MLVLKRVLLGLLGLLAVLVGGGFALSSHFEVTRSIQISAPPERIYPLIATPRHWPQWSVWNQRDPAMQIDYSGPESGAGATWRWKSKTEGDGSMTLTLAEAPRLVNFDLHMADMEGKSVGEFTLVPGTTGCEVRWTMKGDFGSNPLLRWFGLLADRMMGPDFEAGLVNLKRVAEKPAA